MNVFEIKHPLVAHKIGKMRKSEISTKDFRELASEIAQLLAYEATKDLETETRTIEGWAGDVEVEQIKGKKITIVPILRAGIGMQQGVLELIPGARVSVVGFERNPDTLEAEFYYEKLSSHLTDRPALVIDPMLATGGTAIATIDLLKKAGCQKIKALFLVAAPEGIAKLHEKHPDVDVYTASVDKCLNEDSYILPGLGDAGDKIFGTVEEA